MQRGLQLLCYLVLDAELRMPIHQTSPQNVKPLVCPPWGVRECTQTMTRGPDVPMHEKLHAQAGRTLISPPKRVLKSLVSKFYKEHKSKRMRMRTCV